MFSKTRIAGSSCIGMSRIDTAVILGFLGIGLAAHLFPDAIWKILGVSLLVIVVSIVVSVNVDESRRNAQWKSAYEKGEIEQDAYIAQVGEKYYRKHHGQPPGDDGQDNRQQ